MNVLFPVDITILEIYLENYFSFILEFEDKLKNITDIENS